MYKPFWERVPLFLRTFRTSPLSSSSALTSRGVRFHCTHSGQECYGDLEQGKINTFLKGGYFFKRCLKIPFTIRVSIWEDDCQHVKAN